MFLCECMYKKQILSYTDFTFLGGVKPDPQAMKSLDGNIVAVLF